jgi:D-alanine-D-alanine ligase
VKIGLTYDLRSEYLSMGFTPDETAEFDRDDTIDAIEKTLNDLGHETDRIGNGRRLTERLVHGNRWDLVFNIAEGLSGIAREAQVPAILDLYEIPYTFSDPLVMSLTLHKAMTKRIIRDAGLATADFHTVNRPEDVNAIPFDPPYFIKPVAEGTGKGISSSSIVRNRGDLFNACKALLLSYSQPVLAEPYLSGREFTVGIVGTGEEAKILGTIEVHLLPDAEPGVYSYMNKERFEELVRYSLIKPEDDPTVLAAETLCLAAWRVLGCRDGGRMDIRCDALGRPMFMEVNPLAGLHPKHSDLPIICTHAGISYKTLIHCIVRSAAERVK